ncbi:hypothetical protein DV515_00007245 [Chloebia gouldiae]|uniref:Uncharacterized protein n=1 Tax=Chloebia gouldiae TaxID=44316 RepID=A0A3L8SJB9_CHLGU|nr:hypothetical protein DV515_00007245 [Chloebia gouldiae]
MDSRSSTGEVLVHSIPWWPLPCTQIEVGKPRAKLAVLFAMQHRTVIGCYLVNTARQARGENDSVQSEIRYCWSKNADDMEWTLLSMFPAADLALTCTFVPQTNLPAHRTG